MSGATSAEEVARELADKLEARGVDYAVGGALALAQWGVVRGTLDVDLNLWIDPRKPTEAAQLLADVGCEINAKAMIRELADRGSAYAFFRGVHVDVYLPTGEFHESVRRRRKQRPLCERNAWFVSAEDLAVFKMILFRTKDRGDVEALLVISGRSFDRPYARNWLVRAVGPPDIRVAAWDEMAAQADAVARLRDAGSTPPPGS